MFTCPQCRVTLSKQTSPSLGLTWVCPSCHGRALTLERLRHLVPQSIANRLWQRARSGQYGSTKKCPACNRRMAEVPIIAAEDKTLYLDVCTGCRFVWFDTREFETLPKTPAKPPEKEALSQGAKEALAVAQAKAIQRDWQDSPLGDGPEHWWQFAVALCGVPIEFNDAPLERVPVVTWLLTAVIAMVSLTAMTDLETAVADWGLIPAAFGRHLGLTFLTSFFLHGGLAHLIGNLYFLVTFGDNTEDVLGKRGFLLLVALAAIVGDIAQILANPYATIPSVGASGGISGILAYYCLRFPSAEVGIVWWFRWIRLPVAIMFAVWVLWQAFEAFYAPAEVTGVASFAHLGGVGAGILFWWWTQRAVLRGVLQPKAS